MISFTWGLSELEIKLTFFAVALELRVVMMDLVVLDILSYSRKLDIDLP
jgi:hypothetical protein